MKEGVGVMRYFIKQEVFSWRDRFMIKDEEEKDAYYVEGEIFSLGKKLRIYDINDQEVMYIEQKLWKLLPEFHLYVGAKQVAMIKKEFKIFKNDYAIYGPNWKIDGDIWAHDYVITERGKVIADISKRWFSWGDAYEIDIRDPRQEDILLGAVIVIDCVLSAVRNSES